MIKYDKVWFNKHGFDEKCKKYDFVIEIHRENMMSY